MRGKVDIRWDHNTQQWIAYDEWRPGCRAVGTNKTKLKAAMREAQAAYDEARRVTDAKEE